MASHSALTEEGRTRIRNFQGRLASYFVLWLVIGLGVSVAAIWLRTRFGYLPLQRLYLSQYVKASINSLVPHKQRSRYVILVRAVTPEKVIGCTDEEVTPVRDQLGRVRYDQKVGPFFRLKEGVPHTYFYWGSIWKSDREMYVWFRDQIYNKRSLIGLYWICFLPFPLTLILGIPISAKVDLRINREYEEGSLMRGIRLLSRSEYSREMKGIDGLGLPVYEPERNQE